MRREEIAQRLFVIVERLLADGSAFSEISVEQLITEAEIARSTFYVYFEDKGALMVELMDRVTQEIGGAASEWFELPATAARKDLRQALSRLAQAYRQHGRMLSAVIEAAAYDPRVRDEYAAVMQRRFQDMNDSFVPQQRDGTIRADIDIPSVTPWLAWMFERGLYQLVGDGGELPDSALEGVTAVVWQTLYEGTR
ncbi:TetR/AcrR family transcriptional regulator [Mycobacterium sp.]|uniref:TetR/AcrR family transcriptional regulator n=1 Tax=Mycobacterium sp. TaxID=1785 RepID=UPI003C766EE7